MDISAVLSLFNFYRVGFPDDNHIKKLDHGDINKSSN
jgi:hypothetical protein